MISNRDNIIYSTDIIDRIEKLKDEDTSDELIALKQLAKEASSSPDWEYGEYLIRNSYFTKYIMEFLRDCGELPKLPHYIIINEEATANNIQQDYISVNFNGVTYWIRR